MNNWNNDQRFTDYQTVGSTVQPISRTFIATVFLWMFAALGVSALFAFLFASPELIGTIFNPETGYTGTGKLVIFSPIIFVMIMSFGYSRLSATAMAFIFMVYSALIGMSFSVLMQVFSANSMIGCFVSSSAMFGVMAVMGYTTKQDLTSFGRILGMAVWGILIAFLVNFLLHSESLDYIISMVGVAVFTGLTAYKVQMLKNIGAGMTEIGGDDTKKMAIYGALSLYLTFVNLFLMMLRLFGNRRN